MKQRFPAMERYMDGLPLVIVDAGRPFEGPHGEARVDEQDILASARDKHGLERMEQIKYAMLERTGGFPLFPRRS